MHIIECFSGAEVECKILSKEGRIVANQGKHKNKKAIARIKIDIVGFQERFFTARFVAFNNTYLANLV